MIILIITIYLLIGVLWYTIDFLPLFKDVMEEESEQDKNWWRPFFILLVLFIAYITLWPYKAYLFITKK